ncbi:hypothetical protein N9A70_05025 [Akkermansiaceae bacterium]|jgi:hypothetical protein|nr:hypothetical protein [Akkermansiaceae bacterium]MDA7892450.1 hypothetical protein [Akkermansiaceae bacterium]
MKILKIIALLFPLLLANASADPYELGSKVKSFTAKDQHGKEFTLGKETRFLLLSDDMATGKLANAALTKKGAEYLPKKKAVYVANIFGMPAIGRMFAFKKMKTYQHRIIYGDDKDLMTPFPKHPAHVTVLRLDGEGKVTRISYWNPEKEDVETHLK